MTYYEELGLEPEASEAEIKMSYKRLTLLLHPDQHLDPKIRALADTQMKRLNEIVGVLTNPVKRKHYDNSILGRSISVLHNPPFNPLVRLRFNRAWIVVGLAFLVFAGSALLITRVDPPARNQGQPVVPKSVSRQTAAQLTGSSRAIPPHGTATLVSDPLARADGPAPHLSQKAEMTGASKTRFKMPEAQPGSSGLSVSVPTAMATPALSIPTAPADNPTLPAGGIRNAEIRTVSGKWVYAPDPDELRDALLYPAEYVELTVTVNAGVLNGKYRSRYKLSDRTLSPYANFSFNGPANESTFIWLGNDGSRGEVTLMLQTSGTLQANWFATKMGSQLSLGSGAATLYRFR